MIAVWLTAGVLAQAGEAPIVVQPTKFGGDDYPGYARPVIYIKEAPERAKEAVAAVKEAAKEAAPAQRKAGHDLGQIVRRLAELQAEGRASAMRARVAKVQDALDRAQASMELRFQLMDAINVMIVEAERQALARAAIEQDNETLLFLLAA